MRCRADLETLGGSIKAGEMVGGRLGATDDGRSICRGPGRRPPPLATLSVCPRPARRYPFPPASNGGRPTRTAHSSSTRRLFPYALQRRRRNSTSSWPTSRRRRTKCEENSKVQYTLVSAALEHTHSIISSCSDREQHRTGGTERRLVGRPPHSQNSELDVVAQVRRSYDRLQQDPDRLSRTLQRTNSATARHRYDLYHHHIVVVRRALISFFYRFSR